MNLPDDCSSHKSDKDDAVMHKEEDLEHMANKVDAEFGQIENQMFEAQYEEHDEQLERYKAKANEKLSSAKYEGRREEYFNALVQLFHMGFYQVTINLTLIEHNNGALDPCLDVLFDPVKLSA